MSEKSSPSTPRMRESAALDMPKVVTMASRCSTV